MPTQVISTEASEDLEHMLRVSKLSHAMITFFANVNITTVERIAGKIRDASIPKPSARVSVRKPAEAKPARARKPKAQKRPAVKVRVAKPGKPKPNRQGRKQQSNYHRARFTPSPEQIAEACEEIRRGWSWEDVRAEPYTIPVVRMLSESYFE